MTNSMHRHADRHVHCEGQGQAGEVPLGRFTKLLTEAFDAVEFVDAADIAVIHEWMMALSGLCAAGL